MQVICIAALGENFVIGKHGELPWHLPADMAFFKNQTYYVDVIVGRKSFEILGGPLPGRPTIVLTRQENYPLPTNVRKASTLAQALEMVRGKKKVFVIGGTEPYREAIEAGFATHLVLTRVHGTFEGDAFFPEFDTSKWKLTESKFRPRDEKNAYDMTFEVWERA